MITLGRRRRGGPETRGPRLDEHHDVRIVAWPETSGHGVAAVRWWPKARDETPAKTSDTEGSMTNRSTGAEVSRTLVDHIPVVWVEPSPRQREVPLALWLHPLSRSKEDSVPFLQELAGAGFVAVGFDAWQHGERATESGERILERVFGGFRRHMWPILGQTTIDALRVTDWAIAELGAGPEVVAGGVSMGGDVAVALAGVDERVARVAAIVSTPDWTRPGMRDLADLSRILEQGEADAYARWFYERLDPLTHVDAYARGPAIAFECGADDTHVPADGALRFRAAFHEADPRAAERVRVTVHGGVGHIDGGRSEALLRRCLAWFDP
jgi:dienelactone hydrolase